MRKLSWFCFGSLLVLKVNILATQKKHFMENAMQSFTLQFRIKQYFRTIKCTSSQRSNAFTCVTITTKMKASQSLQQGALSPPTAVHLHPCSLLQADTALCHYQLDVLFPDFRINGITVCTPLCLASFPQHISQHMVIITYDYTCMYFKICFSSFHIISIFHITNYSLKT